MVGYNSIGTDTILMQDETKTMQQENYKTEK